MRLSRHSRPALVALLIIILLALPILLGACKGRDVDSPDDPETDQEKESRKAAKMADPDFGGAKDTKGGDGAENKYKGTFK